MEPCIGKIGTFCKTYPGRVYVRYSVDFTKTSDVAQKKKNASSTDNILC